MKFSTKQEILQLENIGSGLFIFGTHADVTSYQNHLLSELYQEAQSDNEMFQTARGHLTSSSPLTSLAVWVVSDEQDLTDIRKTVKTVAQWAAKQKQVSVDIAKLPESKVNHIVQLLMVEIANATYSFDNYKQTTTQQSLQEVVFHAGNHDIAHAVTFSEALIYGMTLCKDLGNTPGNVCTPKYLADTAKEQATELGADVSILDSEAIRQLGMNSFWSVAKGSTEGAYFIELRYHGAKNDAQPIVLVGKGITFDSGGISLKPGEGMDEMKYDMCGAATVLGTFCAAVKLKLPLNLVALIPTCENMPSGGANKPGDIVKTLNGLTVEVLNTDAEGRLILCDALTYAERFNPKAVIDVATLTGACIIALGHVASGVLGNNQDLVDCLIDAAKTSDDKIWQLPLFPEYREALKSNFADLQNIGGRPAGTITAATFLSYFTENYHWAHLDIAGTAWRSGKEKGATGRPVSLLLHYLCQQSGQSLV